MRPLPVSPTSDGARLGARLRAARKAHGYTLDQLATAAGLTKGFVSRVERDETSLSVASLITLCQVMSINPGSLFTAPDVDLIRRDTAPAINLGGTGVSEKLMTPRGQPRVQLVHTTAEPGATGGPDLYTINCDIEVVYILKGSIDVVFADRRERLAAGDALTMRGGEPHTWENPSSSRAAEIVWVLLPAPWSGSA
ncbi:MULTISPECIES: cupin domain-containing protein [unclassified Nocardioides]|uniref:cupin domain-containing protein n=1 Tax=unclassified Nocardioides TaxID=2615069 RepID=UPI0009F07FB0|nr:MULTISPECIES: cupin domain-containing protein [unclassified Nocardioides]GAW51186.1 Transcriptional regulator [Nocardioides sp. PD653-B2]GAW56914.1 Transcriptional regulator [Nocardioides sp. PD653]